MRSKIAKCPIEAMAIFIWIGFVCAISFMEAWLKFRAPNVTLPIGLSIGRVVFNGLNTVEWVLAAIVIGVFALRKGIPSFFQLVFLGIPVTILIIQTFFLFPILSERVDIILSGQKPSPSYVHFYYLILEVLKVVSLFIFGVFRLISLASDQHR